MYFLTIVILCLFFFWVVSPNWQGFCYLGGCDPTNYFVLIYSFSLGLPSEANFSFEGKILLHKFVLSHLGSQSLMDCCYLKAEPKVFNPCTNLLCLI